MLKRICGILLLALLPVFLLPCTARAQEVQARELSDPGLIAESHNIPEPEKLFDGRLYTWQRAADDGFLTLHSPEGIGSFYMIFNENCGPYQVKNEDDGREVVCGEQGYLHDFVDVLALFGAAPKSITISFGDLRPQLGELRVFTEGMPPKDVQIWKQAPEEGVDLMVFPAHGDDEQLFFAGMLPYYAGEKQYEVQVAYSTSHFNYGKDRPHEMLDGLWVVGVDNYPVFGPLPDYLTKNEEDALSMLGWGGIRQEDVYGFVVEQLRRFKPLVAVGHDLKGEYGHGTHRLYGHALKEAAELSGDPDAYPESAEKYGVWEVPKTYLHLYEENPIHMNWDIPLERFEGMTAYEVSKELGYPAHTSQYSGFAWYFAGKGRAEDIEELGPCEYGLCRSTVGPDVKKDDLFENLLSREEQNLLEEQEQQKKELERQRKEQEKQEAEARRQEEEAEKARNLALAQQEAEAAERREKKLTCLWLGAGIGAMGILVILLTIKIRK